MRRHCETAQRSTPLLLAVRRVSTGARCPPPPSASAATGSSGSHGDTQGEPRVQLKDLETIPLVHVAPARISDHVCVHVVRGVRWCIDRLMRDRHTHRATLQFLTQGDAALAASHAGVLREMCSARNALPEGAAIADSKGAAAAAEERAASAAAEAPATTDEGNTSPSPQPLSDGGVAWAGKYELLLSEHATRAGHSIAVAQLVRLKPWEALCVATVRTVLRCFWYLLYLASPRLGHRLTAYIAEENAVITTHLINDVNLGKIDNSVAPPYIAAAYGSRVELAAEQGGKASSGPRLRDAAVLLRADELGFCRRHHDWADALDKYKAATRSGSFRR